MSMTDEQYAAAAWINFQDLGHTMVVVMTAVGMAESQSSGGDTAQSPGFSAGGTGAGGAFQIQNNHTESELGIPGFWSQSLWKNPVTNGKAARKIYNDQGIKAWSAYTNQSYAQYLQRANVAVAAVEAKTGGSSTANDPKAGTTNQGVTNFGQELLAGATSALGLFGLAPGVSTAPSIDKDGNVSAGVSVDVPGIFDGLQSAMWIGGGALLVVLGVIMLAKDATPVGAALKMVGK